MLSSSIATILKEAIADFNPNSAIAICSLPQEQKIHVLYDGNFKTKKTNLNKFDTNEEGFLILPFYIKDKEYGVIKPERYAIDTIQNFQSACAHINTDILLLTKKILAEKAPENIGYNEDEYLNNASQLIENMKEGSLKKIVLATSKIVQYKENPIHLIEKFLKLKKCFPNNFISLHYSAPWGAWLGASPEVLITVDENKTLSTVALAATKYMENNNAVEDVLWSHKEIEEQAMVSRYIINCFKKIRFRQFEEEGPYVVKMGNLAHLKTDFKVLQEHADDIFQLVNDLINLLHPTSAVCGMPKQQAIHALKKYEPFKRSLFAGVVGLSLHHDDAKVKQFYVNIRCVKLFQQAYQLFAGAGLTHHSVPSAELLEIKNKMSLLQDIFD